MAVGCVVVVDLVVAGDGGFGACYVREREMNSVDCDVKNKK